MDIIVHGTIAFDRIKNFPGYFKDNILPGKIHNLNVSFYIDKISEKRGGTGGNIVYNLALLGESPTIVTSAGKDSASYLEYLQSRNINTKGIEVFDNVLTPMADIITDQANNQITAFFVGAAACSTNYSLDQYNAESTIVILSPANNKPDSLRYGAECKRLGIPYVFDPGQTIPDFSGEQLRELIDGSFLFTVNDYELELVKKKTALGEEDIRSMTQVLVITLGDKGSLLKTKDAEIVIPGFMQDKLVDPTGAGDAYRAGLLKGWTACLDLEHMGRVGACAASFAIEHHGTQEHVFTMEDFRSRYQQYLKETCPI